MGGVRKRKNHMSAKTLIIAAAALAASTAMTVPSFAAGGDGTGPNGTGPGANAPAAATNLPLRAEVLFNLLDTNHDGAVDQQEFTALSNAVFNALDKNHDGKLEQDELPRQMGAMMQGGRFGPGAPGNWHGRMGDHGGWGRWDGRGPGMMGRTGFNGPQGPGFGMMQQTFASLDTNGDGAITPDEFAAHMPNQAPAPAAADQPQQ